MGLKNYRTKDESLGGILGYGVEDKNGNLVKFDGWGADALSGIGSVANTWLNWNTAKDMQAAQDKKLNYLMDMGQKDYNMRLSDFFTKLNARTAALGSSDSNRIARAQYANTGDKRLVESDFANMNGTNNAGDVTSQPSVFNRPNQTPTPFQYGEPSSSLGQPVTAPGAPVLPATNSAFSPTNAQKVANPSAAKTEFQKNEIASRRKKKQDDNVNKIITS